jgi:hypothetical protein
LNAALLEHFTKILNASKINATKILNTLKHTSTEILNAPGINATKIFVAAVAQQCIEEGVNLKVWVETRVYFKILS